ncbi:MAG: recombination protein NinB [Rikenellaceae bacterium]
MKSVDIQSQKDKEAAKAYIDRLPSNKRYTLVIKQHREKRTLSQNNLFHLWCTCIADETGEDRERIKTVIKELFLGYKEVVVFNRRSFTLPSTSALDTKQMAEFMTKSQAWAASELGIILPLPEDQFYYQFVEQFKNRI